MKAGRQPKRRVNSQAKYTGEKSLVYRVTCLLIAFQKHFPELNAFSPDWRGNRDIKKAQVVQNWAFPAKLMYTNVALLSN